MKNPCHYFSLLLLFVMLFSSCSKDKIQQHKEWKKYFEDNNVQGCILLHDYFNGTFDVYNLGNVQKRTLPAETFLIMNALAGLETGVIIDTNMVIRPDSLPDNGLSGLTMAEAFRTSNIPYFQWVAEKVGPSRMKYWVDSTYYGNLKTGDHMKTFWLDNTIQISPDEQMGLIEKLYAGKLAFQPRSQRLVKALMTKKETHYDTLCYQTGIGKTGNQKTGWILGWLKQKDHPYFFVLKTLAADSTTDLNAKNLNILYKILNDKGLTQKLGHLN